MEQSTNTSPSEELDSFTIFLHFGLMMFGVLAWLTGDWAGDYKKIKHLGFTVHKMTVPTKHDMVRMLPFF